MRMPPNYGPEYTEQFSRVYAESGARRESAFRAVPADGIALSPDLMQADGIHPNQSGQPAIARQRLAGVAAAVQALSSTHSSAR